MCVCVCVCVWGGGGRGEGREGGREAKISMSQLFLLEVHKASLRSHDINSYVLYIFNYNQ